MTVRSPAFALRASLAAAGLSGLACAAQAQSLPIQPGLWDETVVMKTDNPMMASMQARLAAMPPDKRQQIEQMMAAQGVSKDGMTHSARVCMTKEQIARDFVPNATNGNCSHEMVSRSGNSANFTFSCTGRHTVSGTGVFTMTDPKTFSVVSDANMPAQQNMPASHMHSDLEAHFVSSDCGNVQPEWTPPAK